MEAVRVNSLYWRPAEDRTPADPPTSHNAAEHRAVPVPVEVIWGTSFATEIRSTGAGLVALTTAAARLELAAAEAERRASAEGVHGEVSREMMIQLHRFLADLRCDAEEEALALVEGARYEARLVVRGEERRHWVVDTQLERWRSLLGARASRAPSVATVGAVSWSVTAARVDVDSRPDPNLLAAPTRPADVPGADTLPVAVSFDDELFGLDGTDEPALEPLGESKDFWSDDDRPARWSRVRRHLTLASALRCSAVLCVGAALALQLS